MIGNSLRSDIYPALEVGMKAIHVNRETWAYDQMDIDTTNPNYISISNFDRCLDALMVKNNMEHIA
jgi:FMN phosphatase YigB (HAD superfamily)